jgi:D-sedoheptulose 7-phosphate isomerase
MPQVNPIKKALEDAQSGLTALLNDEEMLHRIQLGSQLMSSAIRQKGRIFSCGNGGSMCDAMHFAEELSGRYRLDRPGYAALAISDPSHLSCVANDYGYEFVFSRYLEAHGSANDALLAISTSGTSKNVLKAAQTAKTMGIKVIALTGKYNCALGDIADVHIATPAGQFADRVQELHIKVIHIFIELLERSLAPQNYASSNN